MSSFTAATEINCDMSTTYTVDDLFSPSTPTTINYSQQHQQSILLDQHQNGHQKASTITGVSNFDCLQLQQTNHAGIAPTLPLESLSINNSTINQEWVSPLELDYSDYNQPDMNFLFSYNGLVHSRDLQNMTAASTAQDLNGVVAAMGKDQQQDLKERGAEQFRRLCMMDMSTSVQESNRLNTIEHPFQYQQRFIHPTATISSCSYMGYNGYYSNNNNQQQQKERASVPNVFMSNHGSEDYAVAGGQLSWQQSSLLQKRPTAKGALSSDFSTPNTVIGSSTSSPLGLKSQAKKRSMLEEVLHEDYSPSVVSSLSEPIPTTSVTSQWMVSRKRTKSIRSTDHHHSSAMAAAVAANMDDNNSNSSSISSSSASQFFAGSPTEYTAPTNSMDVSAMTHSSSSTHSSMADTMHHQHNSQEQFFASTAISDPSFYDDDKKNHNHEYNMENNSNNQILAAMPRRQKLRYDGDHYTPKWVRYTGHLKEGYCDSCRPGKWLQLKNSAYWYHKQFYHGISSVSGKSFMKPLEQRMGKGDMIEGLCHQCRRFVPACNGKKKNNFMLWYRHAHKCHLYDKPKATTSKSIRKLSNGGISPTVATK